MKYTKYNIDFFQNFAKNKNGQCLSIEYKNVRTKLLWKCENEHEWQAQPRKILEGSWCPECAFERIRTYDIDHDFFSKETEEAFYIAGFLAADGWKNISAGGYGIHITLAKKDLDHLEKIKHALNIENPIKFDKSICNISKYKTLCYRCTLGFRSKKIYNNLEKFSVFENKTYILVFPEWLKTHPLVHHYMRGYIDGDGCFYIKKAKNNRRSSISFNMKGTVNMLKGFHEVFIINNIVDNSIERREIIPKAGKKYLAFDILEYSGNIILSKMYDFLYKDATLFMDRKKNIAKMAHDLHTQERKEVGIFAGITNEELINKAKELGSLEKVAEFYNCTKANVSYQVTNRRIKKEMDRAFGTFSSLTREEIFEKFKQFRKSEIVANEFGCTKTTLSNLVSSYNLRKEIDEYWTKVDKNHLLDAAIGCKSIRELGRKLKLSNSGVRYRASSLGIKAEIDNILGKNHA